MMHGNVVEKGKSVSRSVRIIMGLQGSLDFERGGDLAHNLDELYAYVARRLIRANAHDDLEILDEVRGLMVEIRDAWTNLPGLMPSPTAAQSLN
jgi:flagellar protein FliS